jgi:hypothetical protein
MYSTMANKIYKRNYELIIFSEYWLYISYSSLLLKQEIGKVELLAIHLSYA